MLKLISHKLCPYVQRAVIALEEKGVAYERVDIDLANKPDWFLKVSPLGKTPVLIVDDTAIFESAVIVEYLEDSQPHPLHPVDPLRRAEHRSWIEFGSEVLNDIGRFYSAPDQVAFEDAIRRLRTKFERLEDRLAQTLSDGKATYFDGADFSVVDAVFGPVFRYFDVFDDIGEFGIFIGLNTVQAWRASLENRSSVRQAVSDDYPALLRAFVDRRGSHLSGLMKAAA